MQEFELINQEKFEINRKCLDEEFEQLINDDFQISSTQIAFANWLEKFLKFIDEVKDCKNYINRIEEFESFLKYVATKYPYYQNSNLFDPESLFSQIELDLWNNTIKYFHDFGNQNEKLIKASEELLFDLYFNKFKRLDFISSNLIEVLRIKKQLNNKSLISDELLEHFVSLLEKNSESELSKRIEKLETTENQFSDSAQAENFLSKKQTSLVDSDNWSRFFVDRNAYDLFLDCVEKLPNTGRHDNSIIVKYALIYHFFQNNNLMLEHINHKAFMKYLTKEHEVKFSDNVNAFPKSRSRKNESNIKLLFKERFPTRAVK